MTTYLADYSNFTNKKDLEEAAWQHKKANWYEMNETDRAVLDMIRRYSGKFGFAQLKHDTIATTIGKSNPTVRRAIRKLDKLEIIDRIHYIRPIMNGLGANIYAIRPFNDTSETDEIHLN